MAAVYAGTHRNGPPRRGEAPARRARSRGETLRRRFLREGYVANRVDHPGPWSFSTTTLRTTGAGVPRDGAARGRDRLCAEQTTTGRAIARAAFSRLQAKPASASPAWVNSPPATTTSNCPTLARQGVTSTFATGAAAGGQWRAGKSLGNSVQPRLAARTRKAIIAIEPQVRATTTPPSTIPRQGYQSAARRGRAQ